jgi:PKD repeat protein
MSKRSNIVVIGAVVLLLTGFLQIIPAETNEIDPPLPPTAGFDWGPEFPQCGQKVTFKSTSEPGNSAIVDVMWSFGATGSSASHTWNEAGDYEVTLTVIDKDDLSDSVTQTIHVGSGYLCCSGSIKLEGNPGETKSDTFTISNSCNYKGSELDWQIDSYDSGLSISPRHGSGLLKGDSVTVTVTCTLPDVTNNEEQYSIIVENSDNPDDCKEVPVVIETSKSKSQNWLPFEEFINQFIDNFPLIKLILQQLIWI